MSHLNKLIQHDIPEYLYSKLKTGVVLTPGEVYGAKTLWKNLKDLIPDIEEQVNKKVEEQK